MTKDFGLVSLDGGDDSGGDAEDGEDQGEQDGEDQSDGSGTPAASSGGGDSDGSCFIATAAYGSAMEPFRDRFMLVNTAGKTFVHLYYSYSPPVANFIAIHDTLRAVVRWSLLPMVGVSWMALQFGLGVTLALLVLLVSLVGTGAAIVARRIRLRQQP